MFEFVGIGDLHLDKLDRVLPGVGNELIADEVHKPFRYAMRNGIRDVIMYGDISDTARMSYSGHCAFVDSVLCEDYRDINKWIVLGNHDFAENGSHSLQIIELFARRLKSYNVHVITSALETRLGDVQFRLLPYPNTDTSPRMANVGHFEVKGSIHDNGRKTKHGDANDHLCFMGHIHTPQKVRRSYYSGTLYQTNFGESLPKFFHHVKVRKDLSHRVVNVPNKPAFTLTNLVVGHRNDLKKVSANQHHLYKLFVQDGVAIRPKDLADLPNVIRINRFKTESELKTQLEDDWKVTEESPTVFQPQEDLLTFLQGRNVKSDVKRRVLDLHTKTMESFFNTKAKS